VELQALGMSAHETRKISSGDLYEPDFKTPDVITLRRIEPPKPKARMTVAEVKAALSKITVKAKARWEDIRKDTREL
jgi:hypothetical protein